MTITPRVAWFTAGAATATTALAASAAFSAFDIAERAGVLRTRLRMTAQERAADKKTCAALEAERTRLRDQQERKSSTFRETARRGFRPDLLTVSALKPEELTVNELVAELTAADEHAVAALTARHDPDEFDRWSAEYEMWSDHALSLFDEALQRRYTRAHRQRPLTRADKLRLEIAISSRYSAPATTTTDASRADETR